MGRQKKILVVDDNPQYRSAVVRNLTMAGYDITEAEDSDEGMEKIQLEDPQVIITDLDMRTHDEGLNFIQNVKERFPTLPIIMISAVGTFDEGALARQYGAMFVLSKSRIEEEIETLYSRLETIFKHLETIESLQKRLDTILEEDETTIKAFQEELQELLHNSDLDPGFKSEIYEMHDRLERQATKPAGWLESLDANTTLQDIQKELPEAKKLDEETQTMLSVAESLFHSPSSGSLSVARNISFSYSFAVEHEVKLRIGRKVSRLLIQENIGKLATQFYDEKLGNLDIFFNQYLIRTIQQYQMELNSDITRQVMERILQHGSKYKPDGLKALGVILFCWGRKHEFSNREGKVEVRNPLNIKGLTDEETTQLASQLILLQHLRNPFIHPEFNEREKTESVRQTSFTCLSLVSQLV